MQTEIQANHCGVWAVAPPPATGIYILYSVAQFAGSFRFGTAKQVLRLVSSKWKNWSSAFRTYSNPKFGQLGIQLKNNSAFVKKFTTKRKTPDCDLLTGNLQTPHIPLLYTHSVVCARPIPPHGRSILQWGEVWMRGRQLPHSHAGT